MTDPKKILEAMTTAVDALEPLEDEEQADALNWISKALGAKIEPVAGGGPGDRDGKGGEKPDEQGMTPKQFMTEKDPKSQVEKVTCLAYFLTHNRGMDTFKTSDLTKLSTEAAQSKFNTSQAVDHATRRNGYLTSGQGNEHLVTTDGERLVRALPDRDAVKQIQSETTRRRAPRKKKASGKG